MDGTGKLIIFLLGFANLAGGNCQTSGVCVCVLLTEYEYIFQPDNFLVS